MDLAVSFTPDLLVAFLTLFVLELVLGVDNVIFISILASKLPVAQQARARNIGLTLAMVMRIGLVFAASWIVSLKDDLFTIGSMGFSGRDLILIVGGAFLIYKAAHEIHVKLEGTESGHGGSGAGTATFGAILIQILLMDLVFSFDSVITAVGMVDELLVIIVAVVLSFGIMLVAAKHIFTFVNAHPSVKILALAFLLLIGAFLVADGFGYKADKALIYGPMAFAILVEAFNMAYRRRQRAARGEGASTAVELRHTRRDADDSDAVAAASTDNAGAVTLSRRPVTAPKD
ncbi:TerC family protein [Litorihabitans aurantiacus]|uniref:Integral membrane protein TerC n=1 Tax=Litorihabitans aurantiacus TaxID=1930061 RepID=A0AA37XD59_9MICO|nr:TerC family protein [Litorihabitans aurantiacus]GMA31186.1 integral membrane protein TerC [Litorihabitans aurantiacus]